MTELAPIVAVIGGGQLARMMAEPAAALGIPLRLLAEAEGVSAAQVIPDQLIGHHTDLEALLAVTEGAAVVTFDHEHVPTEHLRALEAGGVAVRPGPDALVHAQDKAVMRARLTELGAPCPRHAVVASPAEVTAFGLPVRAQDHPRRLRRQGRVVRRRRGRLRRAVPGRRRGRRRAAGRGAGRLPARAVGPGGALAERPGGRLPGGVVDPARRHLPRGGGARPPTSTPRLAVHAQQVALRLAGELDVTGVLAVELFETNDGRVLVNELAMRPHNTGHWTQDGAVTSQFENHLRGVLDLPLGSPAPRARWTVMVNILGGPDGADGPGRLYDGYPHALARDPHLRVHLYGKGLRPGRKVGHVNAYGDDLDDCLERARHAAAWFRGDLGNESE